MSDNQYEDVLDLEETSEGWQKLRELQKKNAARVKELEAELNKLQTEKRSAEIRDAVSAAGLPPAAVELALVQVTDPAEVNEWIEKKRADFGIAQAPEPTPQTEPPAQPQAPAGLPPENLKAWQQFQGADPGQYQHNSEAEIAALLDSATSDEDFRQKLEQLGLQVIS